MANILPPDQPPATPDADFVFAAKRAQLETNPLLAVDFDATAIVLVRDDDGIRALDGKCPHAGAPLAQGALCGKKLLCPWHLGGFDTDTGAWLEPPALRGLRTYPVAVRGSDIFIDLHHPVEPPPAHVPAVATSGAQSVAAPAGPVVFIGSGAVAIAAITALRLYDAKREILVLEPRANEPVDRTQITKNALAGKMPPEKINLLSPEKAAALQFTRIAEQATALDPVAKSITTDAGRQITYGDCVIAVGGIPTMPQFPGMELAGVTTLRARADLEKIRPFVAAAKQAIISGTSFIGMEAASALRDAGVEVTVIGRADLPFSKQFGAEVARAIVNLHEQRGVRFVFGDAIASAFGEDQIRGVRLQSGRELACDVLIVGHGVAPASGFLHQLAKNSDGGITVDAQLRAQANIYVGGDVAYAPTAADPARIEHWRLAQQHGFAIGCRLAGKEPGPFAKVPFFWSQQHGRRFAYIGHAQKWDEISIEGDLAEYSFIAYYLAGGIVSAALTCKREAATARLSELLASKPNLAEVREALRSS